MKIFIIHASAGHGHKMAAEAINEAAVEVYGQNNVKLIDVLDYTPIFFRTVYSNGYIFCISKLTWLWGILFFLSNTKYLKLINDNFRRFTNKLFCGGFLKFIEKENPDVLISTHFLVNELVSFLKGQGRIKTKLVSAVTDFGVHNFWIAKNVDVYTAACNRTKEILTSRNIENNKIHVLGIPIRKQFERDLDRNKLREKLGLKSEGLTALILTGGIGIGPIYQTVKLLNDQVNVIVVCGNNKKLFQQLKQLNYRNLVVLGWIDYVEEVMAVSDIIVTKPGGSTISECLVMDLPMIFFSIIPGQEFQNSQIISEYGMGFIISQPKDIKEKILDLNENPDKISALRNKIGEFKHEGTSRKILELING